jgi:hypothetical protein
VKSLLKVALVSIFVLAAVGLAAAQSTPSVTPNNNTPSFAHFNPGPCDFSNQFYQDVGLDLGNGSELNNEPDGRFGTFRKTGPPATGNQVNWVADEDNCSEVDPTRRDFRILATTGGNADDANSPFTCADLGGANGGPGCANQPGIPETLDFISILAFLHNENAFIGATGAVTKNYNRTVGFINGGLQGVQQNPGEIIAINQGADPQLAPEDTTVPGEPPVITGLNPRQISMQFVVSNFEAYGAIDQTNTTLQCPAGATMASQCSPAPGHFANSPCSLLMINFLQASFSNGQPGEVGPGNTVTTLPTFCFNVADTKDSHGNTISNVATPKLRQNWRFATNRNAMDGSDNNCINADTTKCASPHDSPFGYFCDDLLGMWIITYFWFTSPVNDPTCGPIYNAIGAGTTEPDPNNPGGTIQVPGNGFSPDGFPVILTANELNNQLEANQCGAEGQEDPGGTDGGAAWLVCPAIPDPRNGAITSDAFLDVTTHNSLLDPFISSNFSCLQKTGKFCFESAPGQ